MAGNRYAVDELVEIFNDLRSTSSIDQAALGGLLVRAAGDRHYLTKGLTLPPRMIPIHAHLASSAIGDIGRTLLDLDIELRRTLSFMTNDSTRPFRDRSAVDFIYARHISSTDVFLLLSHAFHEIVTSRPLDFLLTLSWFWNHRVSQTRIRPARERGDHIDSFDRITDLARESLASGEPTVITITVDADGSSEFTFEPGREE